MKRTEIRALTRDDARTETSLQRIYNELKTRWNEPKCMYTRALTGDDARALSVPVQRPGLTRLGPKARRIYMFIILMLEIT